MAFCLGRARDGDLAFRVKRFLAAEGTEEDRRLPFRADQGDRRVDLADVDETARTKIPLRVAGAIRGDGRVVVVAGPQVAPMRVRNFPSRYGLEFEDVDRLGGGGDLGGLLCLLHHVLEPRHVDAGRREERTSGEVPEKPAAGEFVGGHKTNVPHPAPGREHAALQTNSYL